MPSPPPAVLISEHTVDWATEVWAWDMQGFACTVERECNTWKMPGWGSPEWTPFPEAVIVG